MGREGAYACACMCGCAPIPLLSPACSIAWFGLDGFDCRGDSEALTGAYHVLALFLLTLWLFNWYKMVTVRTLYTAIAQCSPYLCSKHRHTDTQTRRHADTQTHRHTDTDTHTHSLSLSRIRGFSLLLAPHLFFPLVFAALFQDDGMASVVEQQQHQQQQQQCPISIATPLCDVYCVQGCDGACRWCVAG